MATGKSKFNSKFSFGVHTAAISPSFPAQHAVESQDEVVVDVGDFEVLLATERSLGLVDEFLELGVQL